VARDKRVDAPRSQARSYLEKAKQFLNAAKDAVDESRHDAAMLAAIHAAISAADAVTVALAGQRSADPDHSRAVDLLDEVGGGATEVTSHARQLRQLLGTKNVVEYESRRAMARDAADAVRRANRLVAWASTVVDAARL
jgi:HEPN domain-containing protein